MCQHERIRWRIHIILYSYVKKEAKFLWSMSHIRHARLRFFCCCCFSLICSIATWSRYHWWLIIEPHTVQSKHSMNMNVMTDVVIIIIIIIISMVKSKKMSFLRCIEASTKFHFEYMIFDIWNKNDTNNKYELCGDMLSWPHVWILIRACLPLLNRLPPEQCVVFTVMPTTMFEILRIAWFCMYVYVCIPISSYIRICSLE